MSNLKTKLPLPPKPGKPGGLGDKIEGLFSRAIAILYNTIVVRVFGATGVLVTKYGDQTKDALRSAVQPILDDILEVEGLPPSVRHLITQLTGTEPISLTLILVGVASAAMMGVVSGVITPVSRVVSQWIDAGVESRRADPSVAWTMTWRSPEHAAELMRHMKQMGWNETIIEAWRQVIIPRLSPVDLFAVEHLEGLGEGPADSELAARGYQTGDVSKMRTLSQFRPGPQDLIRMAVREAWRDDIAERWGYDADFPPEFADWMGRLGDADGWAQRYWRAHWDLPGLNTVLDMLYRVPEFTLDDLDTYLRIQDVPATWRDYMKRVAFREYTRVDTRRMYKAGVLDESAVLKSYLAQGYDEEHAGNLTAFVIADATEEDREATKSDILSGYNTGILSESEAVEWLQEIGYPPDVAGYLIEREAAKRAKKLKARQVKATRNLYLHNELTVSEARTRLTSFGLPGSEIDALLEEWELDRAQKLKRPTQGKLDQFLKDDVITETDYREGLTALGYQSQYIEWYLAQVLTGKAEAAARDEKTAREEQERVRLRKVKSTYQIDKAQLDVDSAELKTAVAETQQALAIRQERYRQEIALARRVVTRAQLEETAQTEVDRLRGLIAQGREAETALVRQIEGLQDRIAATRVELETEREGIAEDLEALRATVAEAEEEVLTLQEGIETYQTEVATLKLAIATDSEEITQEEAQQEILARMVLIEQAQDKQAALDIKIAQTEEAARLKRATVELIARQVAEYQLSVDQLQTERADIEITTQEYRTEIERTRAQLRADLAGLAVVRSVAEIEEEYLTDHETLTVRLVELRSNLAQVQESKALLSVGFREAQRGD